MLCILQMIFQLEHLYLNELFTLYEAIGRSISRQEVIVM